MKKNILKGNYIMTKVKDVSTIRDLIFKFTERERLLTLKEFEIIKQNEEKELEEIEEDITRYECQYDEILKGELDIVQLNIKYCR